MDDFMGELESRLKVSITDSTMMCIVHDAMDRAHEKVKSRGVIARLSEMSRFYELAIIQLEGCLRFVQEEAEALGFDSAHQDLLIDLAGMRNHLLGRLEESEMAISYKDRELMDRTETEWRLRQALELKERELDCLKAKGDGFNENKELSKLKSSVDQQVSNIRHNLEDPDEHYDFRLDWEGSPRDDKIDNTRIERMGLDISNLKETLDLAFGKMQSAIFSSESSPTEQQRRWAIERDVTACLIKGFVREVQECLGAQKTENVDLHDKMQKLKQENEEMVLRERTSAEIYVDLLRGLADELFTRLLDFETEVQLREGVLNSTLKKAVTESNSAIDQMLKECEDTTNIYKTGSRIEEEIHRFVYEETIRSIDCAGNTELNERAQIEDTEEDDIPHCDRSVKDQSNPNSMVDEFGKALEELASSTGQSLREFSEVISNSQQNISNSILENNTRLENMRHHLDLLSEQTNLLKKRESVYEKAFIRRCQNLQKAETEVDLLADQVDLLLGLLKMIYRKLSQHSKVLEQHIEVSEILTLIAKELDGKDIRV